MGNRTHAVKCAGIAIPAQGADLEQLSARCRGFDTLGYLLDTARLGAKCGRSANQPMIA
jgi:hypothetical protein